MSLRARSVGEIAEVAARSFLCLVGLFLLCVGVHEALLARDLSVRLAGWGLIAGGLAGLASFPMRGRSGPRLVAPALCGLIGLMVGGYLVACPRRSGCAGLTLTLRTGASTSASASSTARSARPSQPTAAA